MRRFSEESENRLLIICALWGLQIGFRGVFDFVMALFGVAKKIERSARKTFGATFLLAWFLAHNRAL
jgi:uncharacterized membrane protein YuzA (DUF378 family)